MLGAAQFLMVLDQAVMNVAISQLVEDFDTTVTTIQAVIALYALVMAGLMLTGGKLGDIWGRRRAFTIGLCIYARRLGADRRLLERALADARLVDPRGDRRGARHPGPDRARRRQLQGQRSRDRLRRARRSGRRRHRGRPDPRRLGDDRAELAGRLRRRGRRRDRDPARHAADPRAGAREEAPRLDWVGSVLSAAGLAAARLRRPAGEQLGLAGAAQLADRAIRLLADPVRDRRRGADPRRLRRLGAPPRSSSGSNRSSTCRCCASPSCAAASRCSSPRT